MADYRLSVAELAALDGRPLRVILQDAIRLADVALMDYEQAVLHGESDSDVISRLLEAARYSAGLVKLGLDSGLPLDPAPGVGMVTVDAAARVVVEQTMGMAADLVAALLPLHSHADVVYRDALLIWSRDRMAAAVRGEPSPPLPEAPIVPEVMFGGRESPSPRWRGDTVDAEVVDDDVISEEDQVLLDEYRRLTGREWVDVAEG
jgi:hypothetical protein